MKNNTIIKKHQVVILPTDNKFIEKSQLYSNGGDLGINKTKSESWSDFIPQFLYFISDEPIKEGDWVYECTKHNKSLNIFKATEEDMINLKTGIDSLWFKIIATTNSDLWNGRMKGGRDYEHDPLTNASLISGIAKIDISFIEAYVKEQGKIDIVLLEGIYVMPQANGTRTDGKIIDEISLDPIHNTLFVLKLKPNGSVIVHPVKEKMYSKEEVEKLCRNAMFVGQLYGANHERRNLKLDANFPMGNTFKKVANKWIEENY